MKNHVDCFHAALTVLAGHGHIKQRLIKAYEDHLADIDEEDIPIGMKQAFADLRQSLQRVTPHNGESRVCASVRKMSVDEASECASRLVSLFAELASLGDYTQVRLPLNDEDQVRVPPFLVKSV